MAKKVILAAGKKAASSASNNDSLQGKPELIVLTRASQDAPAALNLDSHSELQRIFAKTGGLIPLFPRAIADTPIAASSAEVFFSRVMEATAPIELHRFHTVSVPGASQSELEYLAEDLRSLPEVEGAYVKPPVELAINDMLPAADEPPAITPDFSSRQGYLDAAPSGIDARYAWRFRGGRGAGIKIIDCEWGWRFHHEDLQGNTGGVVVGTPNPTDDNHGTAVLGEFSGDNNSFGITGICSDARVSAASFEGANTATMISQAASLLSAGDVLLLEIHRPGPGASGIGQDGFIAIEWWPDDYAAIRYAVGRGVIVVEAAGNGSRSLDLPIYDSPLVGFPVTWKNPFNPLNPQSEAIVVGAGAPPPGTHGRDHGPDRSRLDFSNYGRRIDAQGWGREVTTTGYGDLQGGVNRDLWYTDQFNGTSSASPIIAGTLGCLQGILRAQGQPLLTPSRARQLLRSTGSPQQDAPGRPRTQRIGNRPDLRQLIPAAGGGSVSSDLSEADPIPIGRKTTITIRSGETLITVESTDGIKLSTS